MDIPAFPESKPLVIDDKPLLDRLFANLQPSISELTFAGLFLFRVPHAYRLTLVNDALVVLGQGYDQIQYFFPPLTGPTGEIVVRLLREGLVLYGADEAFVQNYLPDHDFELVEDRDNFDYLYLRQELAELPGNRYHKKKNRINYFLTRHSCSVEPYRELYRDSCLTLLDEWLRVHERTSSQSLAAEFDATREALDLVSELGLEGLVALVEGEVKGFVLGERLNRNTSVCHFEKADPFLDGLYQLLNREFSRILFPDCTYVNREQDLGELNLRESKLSYHPYELIKKLRVRQDESIRNNFR